MIRLRLKDGEENRYVTLREATGTIGRSRTCDVCLPDARGLSRFHCRLTLRDGELLVEDLGARNSTMVNGHPVATGSLKVGDRLTLGSIDLVVDSFREEEATPELLQPCLYCGHLYSARSAQCPRCETATGDLRRARQLGAATFPGLKLVREIGAGGMGIVFLAEEEATKRQVAVKILRPHLARNLAYLSRFIEEIRLLTALRHPAIVEVYGRGSEGDLHFLTMEYVEGRSVRELLREKGRLEPEMAQSILTEATRALNAAHQQASVVHGDVKPGNFLLSTHGRLKLCDFGIARSDLRQAGAEGGFAEAEARGTSAYAAPERFEPGGSPTVSSDIYSLGISLFQMLTGSLPFRAESPAELREAHRNAPVPKLEERGGPAHAGLQMFIERCLSKVPARRFRNYPELLADLALLAG